MTHDSSIETNLRFGLTPVQKLQELTKKLDTCRRFGGGCESGACPICTNSQRHHWEFAAVGLRDIWESWQSESTALLELPLARFAKPVGRLNDVNIEQLKKHVASAILQKDAPRMEIAGCFNFSLVMRVAGPRVLLWVPTLEAMLRCVEGIKTTTEFFATRFPADPWVNCPVRLIPGRSRSPCVGMLNRYHRVREQLPPDDGAYPEFPASKTNDAPFEMALYLDQSVIRTRQFFFDIPARRCGNIQVPDLYQLGVESKRRALNRSSKGAI